MGGGQNAGGVEGGDVGGVLQDGAQLDGEPVQLLLCHVQARQAGDVGHIVAGDQLAGGNRGHPVMVGPIRGDTQVRTER